MSKRFLVLFCFFGLSVAFVGCNYVWKPLTECYQQNDCPVGKRCVRAVCRVVTTSGSCKTNADCGSGVCANQQCVTPTEPTREVTTDSTSGTDGGVEPREQPDIAGVDTPTDRETPEDVNEQVPDAVVQRYVSPHKPLRSCMPGASRPCLYSSHGQPDKACLYARQTCSFSGGWSSCTSATALPQPRWSTRSQQQGEVCGDGKDNNCNGLLNEGCFHQLPGLKCQPSHHFNHSDSPETIALHPALLTNVQYSPAHRLLLQIGAKKGILSMYRVDEAKRKAKWVMDMPDLGDGIETYDLSLDGTRVAAATKQRLFVWFLKFDKDSNPTVTHYGSFPIIDIFRLGLRNNARDGVALVTHQFKRPGAGDAGHFSTWKLSLNKEGQMELALHRRLAAPVESYGFYVVLRRQRLNVHPDGSYVVFLLDRGAFIYTLPGLKSMGQFTFQPPPIPIDHDLAFDPKRPRFAVMPFGFTGRNGAVFEVSANQIVTKHHTLGGENEGRLTLGYDPKSGELYMGAGFSGLFKWSDAPKEGTATLKTIKGTGSAYSITPDKRWLYVGTNDGQIRAFSMTSPDGKMWHQWKLKPPAKAGYQEQVLHVETASLAGDKTLVLALRGSSAYLWEVSKNGTMLSEKLLALPHEKLYASQSRDVRASFSKDGSWLAFSYRRTIYVFQRDNNGNYAQQAKFSTIKTNGVATLAFHPTRPLLLSGDRDGYLHIWSLKHQSQSTVMHIFKSASGGTAWIQGVGFYTNQEPQEFVMATLSDKTTHAFSFSESKTGAITFEKVAGTLPINHTGNLQAVRYTKHNSLLLWFYVRDANTPVLIEQGFVITAPTPTGHREFYAKGAPTSFKIGEAGAPSTLALAHGSLQDVRVYGVTSHELFVWYCKP